jgi:hypothetical protein
MPTVEWLNPEQTILIQRFIGEYGVAEYQQVATETAKLLKTVDHPVDIILDFTEGHARKENFLASLGSIERKVQPNQRLLVVIKASSLLKNLATGMQSVAPKATDNMHFVETLEQALHLIQVRGRKDEAPSAKRRPPSIKPPA